MSKKHSDIAGITALIVISLLVAVPLLIHFIGKERAARYVRGLVRDLPDIHFEVPDEIGTEKAAYTALRDLVKWEEDVKSKINESLSLYGENLQEPKRYKVDKKEDRHYRTRKEKWQKLRESLEEETNASIEKIFQIAGNIRGIDKEKALKGLQAKQFKVAAAMADLAESGQYAEAYDTLGYFSFRDGYTFPMDLVFGLYPEEMKTACEEKLQEVLRKYEEIPVLIDLNVSKAEAVRDRYGIEIEGLDEARKKSDRLNHLEERRQEQKKAAASNQSKSAQAANRSSGSNGRRKISTYHPSALGDPDSHDIESYYDDNRDEYNDYDDAYDGFLDDDSAWDDY